MNRQQWRAACVAVFMLSSILAQASEKPVASLVRSAAPDWPQWRGPKRDGVCAETGLLPAWPKGGPKRLWTVSGLGNGYSSPIVVGDTIYITGDQGDDLVISALGSDGSRRWSTRNGKAWNSSVPGSRATCTFDGEKLYHMNAHGRLACLAAVTGAELWAVDTLQRFKADNITWGICESVLVHGDRVFVTPAGKDGLMAALDKRSGATVWVTPSLPEEHACYGSPILVAIGGRQLVVNSGPQYAFAVDAESGKLCWQVPQVDRKNTLTSTPVLAAAGDMLIFTNASRDYGAVLGVRFDAVRAEKAWTREVTIGQGGLVYGGGVLVGSSERGEIKGWLAINPDTGKATCAGDLPVGAAIYADKRFYCLSESGTMALRELTGEGFRTTGSFVFAKKRDVWAHPVICKGRLYLRCHDELSCYDIRAKGE